MVTKRIVVGDMGFSTDQRYGGAWSNVARGKRCPVSSEISSPIINVHAGVVILVLKIEVKCLVIIMAGMAVV